MNSFNKNLIPGAILILLGGLFLADNFDWFSFNWSSITRLWPLLLILLGGNMLLGKRSPAATTLTIILLAVAVPLALVRGVRDKVSDRFENFGDRFDSDNDNNDDNDDEKSSDNNNDDNDTSVEKNQTFSEPFDAAIKTATLKLSGGIAKFELSSGSNQLLEASSKISGDFSEYNLNKVISGSNAEINIKPKDGNNGDANIDFSNDEDFELKNKLDVKLNPNLDWTLDVEFGAGKADLDLSDLKVKKLNLKSGVASTEVKLGDKSDTEVKVESGVASVEIAVPEAVGCRINTKNEALNIKDFDGFVKNGDMYETANYAKSTKKINIVFESGISKLKVRRY